MASAFTVPSDNYWSVSKAPSISGYYQLDRRDNENDLLRVLGVSWLGRKILGFIKPLLRMIPGVMSTYNKFLISRYTTRWRTLAIHL